jgi:hypothetical protein
MKVHKLGVVALALTFVLSAPVASAASLSTNVNCAWGTADQAQCIENALNVSYTLPDPIGVVAYAPTSCSYFIIHTDDQFVIARDVDKKDNARRGDAINANPKEDGKDFKRGKAGLMLGSIELRSLIFDTHQDARSAAVAYMAKCGR